MPHARARPSDSANMAGWRDTILGHGGFEEQLGFNYFRKQPLLAGEETMLGERIRRAGLRHLLPPSRVGAAPDSQEKTYSKYFLKRHFWEGTTIQEMALLGTLGTDLLPYFRYHVREAVYAFARFLLPGYENRYSYSKRVIRMSLCLASRTRAASFRASVVCANASRGQRARPRQPAHEASMSRSFVFIYADTFAPSTSRPGVWT